MNKFRRIHCNNVSTQQEMDSDVESRELYPVLEEPEYMDESEEYTLEATLERIINVANSSSSSSSSMDYYDEPDEGESPAQQPHHSHHHNNHHRRHDDDKENQQPLIWRGSAKETMTAIAKDRILCRECFMCHETVFGLDDAFYLICPRCYTYCPPTTNDHNHDDGPTTCDTTSLPSPFGLALGLDINTLWDCQAEILLLRVAAPTTTTARRSPGKGRRRRREATDTAV
jgi:hypothetical protein